MGKYGVTPWHSGDLNGVAGKEASNACVRKSRCLFVMFVLAFFDLLFCFAFLFSYTLLIAEAHKTTAEYYTITFVTIKVDFCLATHTHESNWCLG